jgi:prepilin-type N-terminal cleavage/methylation domain-containing protein
MFRVRQRRFAGMRDSAYPSTRLRHSYLRRKDGDELCGEGHGFTIVELLIVVVILSIIALTAIPMMSSAASIQIRSAANMIAADIEYARSMAISRGQNYSVVFDKNTDSYKIVDLNNNVIQHPVKKGFTYEVDFRNERRLSQVDITNANFNGMQTVTFDCLGSPVNGGTVNLQAGGISATISVEPVTGFVSIQ